MLRTFFYSFWGLCQMVLMTSKTSLQKWSGVFLFPSVSPVFLQIGTVTYQHRLRFRWRGFVYEFLPLIRKARTCCDLTGFHLAARFAQVLSLGRLACWRSSRPGARGLSDRFHTLSLSRAPRLCPVAFDGNEGGNDRFSCIGIVSFYSIAKIFCEYKNGADE